MLPQPCPELEQLPRLPPQDGIQFHLQILVRLQPHDVEQAVVRVRPEQADRHVLLRQAGVKGQGRHLLPGTVISGHDLGQNF